MRNVVENGHACLLVKDREAILVVEHVDGLGRRGARRKSSVKLVQGRRPTRSRAAITAKITKGVTNFWDYVQASWTYAMRESA